MYFVTTPSIELLMFIISCQFELKSCIGIATRNYIETITSYAKKPMSV